MSIMNAGTPQTLSKAISNAFDQYIEEKSTEPGLLEEILKVHLADFIRNKLGPIMLAAEDNSEVEKYVDKFTGSLI